MVWIWNVLQSYVSEAWEEMKHIHTRNTKVIRHCVYVLSICVCVCVYFQMYIIIYFSTYICVTKRGHEVEKETWEVGGREGKMETVSSYTCTHMCNRV